jgi:ABC-2 type transport system ATP-binding protein
MQLLAVQGVHKVIEGTAVLRDISFALGPGITALLGENGAGKSTLLRIISGVWKPTAGDVLVNGHSLLTAPAEAKRHLGLEPEDPQLHPSMTARLFLDFIAAVHRAPQARVEQLCADFGVIHFLDTPAAYLSQGQRRLITLVGALVPDGVLLLDEPTNALDVLGVSRLTEIVQMRRHDRLTLISTHQMEFVEKIAGTFLILRRGTLLAAGTLDHLRTRAGLSHGTLSACFAAIHAS